MKSLHHKAPRVSPSETLTPRPPHPQTKPPLSIALPPPLHLLQAPLRPLPPRPPSSYSSTRASIPPVHLRARQPTPILPVHRRRFLLFICERDSRRRFFLFISEPADADSSCSSTPITSRSSASRPSYPPRQICTSSRAKMAMHKRKHITKGKESETKRQRASSSSSPSENHHRSSIDDYKTLNVIYQSLEGLIFQATHRGTGDVVAVKVQHLDDGSLPPEVTFHSAASFRHPRIIRLREVIVEHGDVYMVMDFVKDDLRSLLVHRFDEERVRTIMQHLLEGLAHIHHLDILHRDINPENLLVTQDGAICICDFGLACKSNGAYPAGKLPYCAPEMLIGVVYGTAVDIWAAGCVMYELLFNKKLFEGYDEMDVLDNILYSLGKPSEKEWPELYECPLVKNGELDLKGVRDDQDGLGDIVPCSELSYYGFDLLSRLLTINPQRRITASAALLHPWFDDD